MMSKSLVFARTHRTAQMVARGMGLQPRDWMYVVDESQVRGYDRAVQIFVYDPVDHPLTTKQYAALCGTKYRGMSNVRRVYESELVP